MKTNEVAKKLTRELRKKQTKAEKLIWQKLRNKNFAGFKFTRQHPIYYFKDDLKKFFIADFYCHELRLVIELDGGIHQKQKGYDYAREELLKVKKLQVLRFLNEEIENNIHICLISIMNFIRTEFPSLLSQRRARVSKNYSEQITKF